MVYLTLKTIRGSYLKIFARNLTLFKEYGENGPRKEHKSCIIGVNNILDCVFN
jgi:hypothetical protein